MAKLNNRWIVQDHGPLQEITPGLLTVVGQIKMPLGNFPRRMTVVGLPRHRTALFSPIPLREHDMATIEALGAPAFMIVPNGGHRLDIRAFKERYPSAKIVAAKGAEDRVSEAVSVDTNTPDLGPDVDLINVAGFDDTELALLIRHDGGSSLIVNDVIGHVAHPKGVGARIMSRLFGFGPGIGVPRIVRRFYLKDRKALATQLDRWARIEDLLRVVPSHGDIIGRPAAALRRLADNLRA
jgi:hypothetical protein